MVIVELMTGQKLPVAISSVEAKDFRQITKKKYFFDWKRERGVPHRKMSAEPSNIRVLSAA
jgi:hypothetical protein